MEHRSAARPVGAARTPQTMAGRRAYIAEGLTCASLTWGVLAFGAVYPWGYWPLAVACGAAGVLGLWSSSRFRLAAGTRGVAAVMALVAVAALVQLVPLPVTVLARISPHAATLVNQLDVRVAHGLVGTHSLSVDPSATWRALALFVCFGVTVLGVARCSTRGALRLAWFISWLGMAVALIGVVQKPLYAGAIYGFWTPLMHGTPFGPFVNKNHFAGWVVMAIPLALGGFCAMVNRARVAGVRDRLLWLSSRDGNRAVQAVFAVVLMGLALALTLSRSGMLSLAAALIVCGWAGVRRHRGGTMRPLAIACVMLALFVAVEWAGFDTVVARFDATDTAALSGRIPIWRGATSMAADFWGTGSGLNTYGIATLFYPVVVPAHHLREAHNDYLQLAVEGGLLLGAPILIAIAGFVIAVRRRLAASDGTAYWVRLGAVGGIVAVAVQSAVDFSLQMPGNAALFATLCGVALHEERYRSG
jgi:O-Antigen ligase